MYHYMFHFMSSFGYSHLSNKREVTVKKMSKTSERNIYLEIFLQNFYQPTVGRRGYLAKGCSIFCHNKAESSLDTIFTEELKL